ncbi:aminotransferase class V-fold PLP-dependent enzyme [soil metagenome]
MSLNRRDFLLSTAALAAAGAGLPRPAPAAVRDADQVFPPGVRDDFLWATTETFINSAAYSPISRQSTQAMHDYIAYRAKGRGDGRRDFGGEQQQEVKALFAELINAKVDEIAFCQSTSHGENIVLAGLDLPRAGGNVVIDDLHYNSSLYIYKMLEQRGLEVRIVKNRDWVVDPRDVERAVDRNTRLVSMALVSNVNGFLHDVRAISDVAHASGALVYADIIQAAGSVPVDVRAMGLDACACSHYKWLMADRGLGFLYIREDLQGSRIAFTQYGHRQYAAFDRSDISWTAVGGARRYETGNIANVCAAAVHESLKYIHRLGLPAIRAHAKGLTARLQRELPAIGYESITPADTPTPIVTFKVKDAADTSARLRRANVAVTVWAQSQQPGQSMMRVSPAVFNTHADIDRLLDCLT